MESKIVELDIFAFTAWLMKALQRDPLDQTAAVLTRPTLQKLCEMTETSTDELLAFIRSQRHIIIRK